MKLSWGSVALSLCSAAAASRDAHVYILDPRPATSPQTPEAVNPETARYILAQRLGLSRFHSIKQPNSDVVRQINAFGGRPQKLFGDEDPDGTKAHVLLWVEDAEDAKEIIQTQNWQSSFTIPSPPPAADNDRLIQDMILQAESLPKETDPKGTTYIATTVIDHILSELKQPTIYNEYLTILHADKKDQFSSRKLAIAIENLRAAAANREGMFSVTVVLMPPSSSHSKRTAQPYGTYDLPSKLGPRREASEAPLSPVSSKPSTSPNVPDLEDSPVITQAEQNNTTPVLGILKQCYSSESECTQTTNSCSGHGKCALFREGEKGSGGRTDCYACVCVPSVSKVGDTGMETHIKTTYWGGPACQKKDVSVPFWLFVGSGVLLAFLISTGIGMLYSMGNEELPSVIGAGVSGPTRK